MVATEPIFDVNVKSLPAGGQDVTVVGPLDGSGNLKVSVQSAPGSQTVAGPDASGSPPTHNPVYVAGSDGTDVRPLLTDSTGKLQTAVTFPSSMNVTGPDASGTPPSHSPLYVAGFDGTDVRPVLVDTSGRPIVNVNGTVPVSVAGTINTAATGTTAVAGKDANGAVPTGNPVLGAGSDGTDVRTILTDSAGRQVVNINGTVPVSMATAPDIKQGTVTDRSGTVTTGGTAQTVMNANASRRYLLIQNVSSGTLWFNFTTTAVQSQPSLELTTGMGFVMEGSYVSTEAVSIIGATTGQAFTAKEG